MTSKVWPKVKIQYVFYLKLLVLKYLGSLCFSQTVERVLEFAIQINKSEQILKKQSKHSKFKSSQEDLAVQIKKKGGFK